MHIGAFGMSTVPEVYAARAMGMEVGFACSRGACGVWSAWRAAQVFGMSLCTNLAAGLSDEVT